MKKTNRIVALAMAAMTALSMTACSGSAKETTEAESAAETTAEAAEGKQCRGDQGSIRRDASDGNDDQYR